MIRSLIIVLIILGAAVAMARLYVWYPRAGNQYISETREQRKSIRVGSPHYGPGTYGTGTYRGGK